MHCVSIGIAFKTLKAEVNLNNIKEFSFYFTKSAGPVLCWKTVTVLRVTKNIRLLCVKAGQHCSVKAGGIYSVRCASKVELTGN
jgi:hypothetical protein